MGTNNDDVKSAETVAKVKERFIKQFGCDHLKCNTNGRRPDGTTAEDLKQMAVIVASFVYMAAQRDQMFPRKPVEKELPPPPPLEDDDNASPVTNPAVADRPQQPRPALLHGGGLAEGCQVPQAVREQAQGLAAR